MFIEGMGLGPGAIRPKSGGPSAPKRTDSDVERAEAAESVAPAADRVELSQRAIDATEGIEARVDHKKDQPSMDAARLAQIRDRIASGFYETEEVLKAILSGLEIDSPELLL